MSNIAMLIKQCSSKVSPQTMYAIIKTESKGNYLAININGQVKLKRQPQSYTQAVAWVDYLEQHNYNIDIGLAQVNIANAHKFGYRGHDMLNPCTNLKLASKILYDNYLVAYAQVRDSSLALIEALSQYNSGNYNRGLTNGYVDRVIINGKTLD
jgi:type IV secretion system protein VirB1